MIDKVHISKVIFLVTADYRNPPVTPPYAVLANNKKDAKEYFQNKYACFSALNRRRYIIKKRSNVRRVRKDLLSIFCHTVE